MLSSSGARERGSIEHADLKIIFETLKQADLAAECQKWHFRGLGLGSAGECLRNPLQRTAFDGLHLEPLSVKSCIRPSSFHFSLLKTFVWWFVKLGYIFMLVR